MNSSQPDASWTLKLRSAAETQALAARLGSQLRIGDVVALSGPLGAGKTTFVQGLARGLGVPEERHVASPTFALVNEHPGRISFVHVDFYRIRDAAELPELGIEEAYDRGATAIEWAERFPDWLPQDALHLELRVEADGSRTVWARGSGPRGRALIDAMQSEPP